MRLAACAGGLALLGTASLTPTTSSFYYDLESLHGAFEAGTWEPVIPAACGDLAQYQDVVVFGTEGPDDPLPLGGSHPPPGSSGNQPEPQPTNKGQIILGLSGDDVIYGGNAKDCLVGGNGNDTIYGNNGSDIILGGRGEDELWGDNGPDDLDGGDDDDYLNGGKGPDDCVGGPGVDQLVSCNDSTDPDAATIAPLDKPQGDSQTSSRSTTPPAGTEDSLVEEEPAREAPGSHDNDTGTPDATVEEEPSPANEPDPEPAPDGSDALHSQP